MSIKEVLELHKRKVGWAIIFTIVSVIILSMALLNAKLTFGLVMVLVIMWLFVYIVVNIMKVLIWAFDHD